LATLRGAHSSIYDERCAELARLTGATVVDGDLNQCTTVGPIQDKIQYERVERSLENARTNGKMAAGGQALEGKNISSRHDRARH
jgi:acyl-CoA reductase-like NAD-dependent aldehyde dehydrogenase